MDVKQAVINAKVYLADLYREEKVSNVGLEEVELDEHSGTWNITIGFSRPWDEPRNPFATLTNEAIVLKRSYKVVRINDSTGEIVSVKDRELVK